jgi:eukaryotic-like serine/threonine-protein kinase
MLGDVRLQLSAQLHIVPRADWSDVFRQRQPGKWTAALSAPLLRTSSRLIDEPTRRFLELFREPTAVTNAVLRAAKQQNGDPVEILESAVPLLESLLRSRLLVHVDASRSPDLPAAISAEPGTVIHDWEVVRPLRVLADTQVYLATRAGRKCVLKVVSSHATWQKAAIRNEAAALSMISHPAVPFIIDGNVDLDQPYLALQQRAGQHCTSAGAALRRLPMPTSRVRMLEILARITEIYADLHDIGVIHGDVQPRNLLVDSAVPDVSVLDFGFATHTNGDAFGSAGAPRGGVESYRAPELFINGGGFRAATAASEQYAVGCLCFELATGTFPFDRMVSSEEFRLRLSDTSPRGFGAAGARGWTDLEAALADSLNKTPDTRYASMRDFAACIGALRDQAISAQPSRPRRSVEVPAVAPIDEGLTSLLYPPLASINYGAAGVAYSLYRRAQADQDGAILASALSWSRTARTLAAQPGAFTNTALGIDVDTVGTAGLYHSPVGVHLVEAMIAYAADEPWEPALAQMLNALTPNVARLDLATGRAGQLLACGHALSALQHHSSTVALRAAGDAALSALWERDWRLVDDVPGCGLPYVGVAHGWAGILFATFTWCRLRDRGVPKGAIRLLADLVDETRQTRPDEAWWPRLGGRGAELSPWSGWCHGSAGYALLFCEISRSLGSDYVALAEAAARHAERITGLNISLCCGLAGVAYALLAVYRSTASEMWLRKAHELARRARENGRPEDLIINGLYKGSIALPTLEADLRAPASAVMPLFEVERW